MPVAYKVSSVDVIDAKTRITVVRKARQFPQISMHLMMAE
jgi:hypothetical protein